MEVYSEEDDKWITIDVYRDNVDCIKEIYQKASHPMIYVFSWNNVSSVKDVSARYIPKRERQEDNDLNILRLAVPLPTTVSG